MADITPDYEDLDQFGIEPEDICRSGRYQGHKFGCHVFECDGIGCILPAGHCDCGFPGTGAKTTAEEAS